MLDSHYPATLNNRAAGITSLFAVVLAVACNKESPAVETNPAAAVAQSVASVLSPSSAAAAPTGEIDCATTQAPSVVEDPNFTLRVNAAPTYTAGQQGQIDIELRAKNGYHANDKYPYKLKLAQCPGMKYAKELIREDGVQVDHDHAKVAVAFEPETAGLKTFAGTFSFSVCSEENCLVEKKDLSLKLNVQ